MAKNAGNYQDGAATRRSQFKGPNENFIKRDTKTGRFINQKNLGVNSKVFVQKNR